MKTLEKRVVITGLGVISPVGIGKDAFWKALLNGESGIGPITHFDAAEYTTRIAGEVKDFDPAESGSDRSQTGDYHGYFDNDVITVTVPVTLKPGYNTVRMGNSYNWAPDIDCFTLSK